MLHDSIRLDLERIYRDNRETHDRRARLSQSDVTRWTGVFGGFREQLYDEIAIHLAVDFHHRLLSFDFCDAILNDLFGEFILGPPQPPPEIFYEIYCAFDEGEFRRSGEADPIEEHTRPLIADLVQRLSLR